MHYCNRYLMRKRCSRKASVCAENSAHLVVSLRGKLDLFVAEASGKYVAEFTSYYQFGSAHVYEHFRDNLFPGNQVENDT